MADSDTLPQWLYQRYGLTYITDAHEWDDLNDGDRLYWAHEAEAVRRAVARGGFRQPYATGVGLGAYPAGREEGCWPDPGRPHLGRLPAGGADVRIIYGLRRVIFRWRQRHQVTVIIPIPFDRLAGENDDERLETGMALQRTIRDNVQVFTIGKAQVTVKTQIKFGDRLYVFAESHVLQDGVNLVGTEQ
jgi:hypothetical protein